MTVTLETYYCTWNQRWSYYLRDGKRKAIAIGGFHKTEQLARNAAMRTIQKHGMELVK